MTSTVVAKALSIRQPWVELILSGKKEYELRSKPNKHRGFLWIHASLKVDEGPARLAHLGPGQLRTGAILGAVRMVECVEFTPALAEEMRERGAFFGAWIPDHYAWHFSEPRRLARPFPCAGKLSMFYVEGPSPDDLLPVDSV